MTALLLSLPLAAAAPIPKDFKPANETLHGTWEFVSATYGGQPDSSYDGAKWELRKDGTATRFLRGDGGTATQFKADPKTRAFDWTISGSRFPGLYEIKGDTLTVALALDEVRPTEFAGPSVYVFTMKKRK